MESGAEKPGALFILPCGLAPGGVTSWALRLVNALCAERPCGLVVHRAAAPATGGGARLDPRVRLFDLSQHPPVESASGNVEWLTDLYALAVRAMGGRTVLIPTLLGDCFGACAALTRNAALDVRLIGFAHSENGYDARVIEHYAAVLARGAAVSRRLAHDIGRRCPTLHIRAIVNGVEPGIARSGPAPSGPRTIVYTGRMDEGVKRVSALIHMSDALEALGVEHALQLVGDGPGAREIDTLIAARGAAGRRIGRVPEASSIEIRRQLRESEFFVLPSRFEGLSVSMLEAMSEGCCCVVGGTNSGAPEAIEHGASGVLLNAGPDDSPEVVGKELAAVIAGISREHAWAMGEQARIVARERFSLHAQVRAVSALIDDAAGSPRLTWPRDTEPAFTARPGMVGSGTVPRDADVRLRAVMDELKGRRVAVYGTGRHSIELAHVLREYAGEIRAFIDDDPSRHGTEFLNRPVLGPDVLARVGATDLVISSHLHQNAIWSKRERFEKLGVRVHRLYA